MKKICVITSSRADFGLYYWTLKAIEQHPNLTLQLVATGMHLSPEFGYTLKEVENEFKVDKKVEMVVSSDSAVGTAKGMGLAMIGFADALSELKPDILLVLGDRFEMFAATSAATVMNIPIAHIHGGELTLGAIDDALRHSISKMATWHFVATLKAKQRVIQMGEQPDCVWHVGGLGVETVNRLELLDDLSIRKQLNLVANQPIGLVTFHPETLNSGAIESDLAQLLNVIETFSQVQWVFTKANMDAGGREINALLEQHVAQHDDWYLFESLGQLGYLSLMKACSVVVGNSSSGLLEAPALHKSSVNIGQRQEGREQAISVIQTSLNQKELTASIKQALSSEFQSSLENLVHPYQANGLPSEKISTVLHRLSLSSVTNAFYELGGAPSSSIEETVKHLVIAVHPDDETLGCGGTLLKRKAEGHEIYWLIVSSVAESSALSTEAYCNRQQEIDQVAQMYQFNGVYELNLPTTQLDRLAVSDLIGQFSRVMNELQPTHVYVPYYRDVHSDHRVVFDTMMACTKKFRYPFIKQVLMMEVLSETDFAPNIDSGFIPNVFVNVESTLYKKIEILKVYESELGDFPFPRSVEAVEAQAKVRGVAAGCRAAEAFMLIRAFD